MNKMKKFLEEIGGLAGEHTAGFYPHDKNIPAANVRDFNDAVKRLGIRLEMRGNPLHDPVYVSLLKGALNHIDNKNFFEVFKLGEYIRRGQYIELVWMATCIFLAENTKQLRILADERGAFPSLPGIEKLWKKRKEELSAITLLK